MPLNPEMTWRRLRPLHRGWIVGGTLILCVTGYNAWVVRHTIRLGEPQVVPSSRGINHPGKVTSGVSRPAPTGRDPFLPAGEAVKSDSPIVKLKGVVWDSRRPLAVVEDGAGTTYIVKAKDKIGEDQLLSIKPDRITLRKKNGKTYELILGKS